MYQSLHSSIDANSKRGFSLIEVLVALSIFTIVITISVGVLMVLIGANAKAQNTQEIMTNLSFALDSITREIRTGSDYFCTSSPGSLPTSMSDQDLTQNCPNGGSALAFNEGGSSLTGGTGSSRIGVWLNEGTIERSLGTQDPAALTSPDIEITQLRFYVTGATRSDDESPTVTIYVEGVAGTEDGSESMFHVQTTVVQQLLDI